MSFSKEVGLAVGDAHPSDVAVALHEAMTILNGVGRVFRVFSLAYELGDGTSFHAESPALEDLANLSALPKRLSLQLACPQGDIQFVDVRRRQETGLDVAITAATAASLESFIVALEQRLGLSRSLPTLEHMFSKLDAAFVKERSGAVVDVAPTRLKETEQLPAILMITALKEEREFLERAFGLKTQYADSVARGVRHGVTIELISCERMGRVPAAVATAVHLARTPLVFRLIILAGIAGGFAEANVDRGAVLLASDIVDLSARKISADTDFRPVVYRGDDTFARFVSSEEFNLEKWQNEVTRSDNWPASRRPSTVIGPVACTDEVVSNDEWRKRLVGEWDKVLGVETEAGGACAAAEQFGHRVAVVRGVSDLADAIKRDDAWRRLAMGAVAKLIDELLLSGVVSRG